MDEAVGGVLFSHTKKSIPFNKYFSTTAVSGPGTMKIGKQTSFKDYFKPLEKTKHRAHEGQTTKDKLLTFGIGTEDRSTAAKENNRVMWYAGAVKGAKEIMTAWHEEEKKEGSDILAKKRQNKQGPTQPNRGDTAGKHRAQKEPT